MDFKLKYLKYKNKYLNLKNQIGGLKKEKTYLKPEKSTPSNPHHLLGDIGNADFELDPAVVKGICPENTFINTLISLIRYPLNPCNILQKYLQNTPPNTPQKYPPKTDLNN